MYYVYALIDPRSDLPFYIGKGKKKNNRHRDHFKESKKSNSNNHKIYKIDYIKSLNLDIPVKILEDNILDENTAYDIETFYIKKYGRKNIDENGILTNICIDNRPPNQRGKKQSKTHLQNRIASYRKTIKERGRKPRSVESRKALSELMKGKNNPFYGKNHCEEVKLAHSKRMKGNKNGKKSYLFIDPANNYSVVIGEFYNFCRSNNLSISTMEKVCRTSIATKNGKCKGWRVCKLTAETGMDPYSGLIDIFEKKGILVKQGNRLRYTTKSGEEMIEFRKNWTGEKLEVIMQELSGVDILSMEDVEPSDAVEDNQTAEQQGD